MMWPQPITIRAEDLKRAFDDLMSGARTREEISDWARDLRMADDDERLHFEPASAQFQLWPAILYLEGVDLKSTGPSEYLHVTDDFEAYRKEAGL